MKNNKNKFLIRLPQDCDVGIPALEDLIDHLPIVTCEEGVMEMEYEADNEDCVKQFVEQIRSAIVTWRHK